jgi:transcriptional regulator GlxA family with amidase domain
LSPRQFSRAFRAETGKSPAKAVERLRLEAARMMIDEGQHSIDTIAVETGFGERERMRHAFLPYGSFFSDRCHHERREFCQAVRASPC